MQKAQFLSRDKTLYRCKLLFKVTGHVQKTTKDVSVHETPVVKCEGGGGNRLGGNVGEMGRERERVSALVLSVVNVCPYGNVFFPLFVPFRGRTGWGERG